METIADFKRAMTIGSKWHTTHRYIGNNPTEPKDLGIRECAIVQSNSFALRNPESGKPSFCDWPKRGEFSSNENSVTITKEGFCQLVYTKVKE
jgi:hypothetical protein